MFSRVANARESQIAPPTRVVGAGVVEVEEGGATERSAVRTEKKRERAARR